MILDRLGSIDKKLAELAVKSGMWGLLAGMIPIAITLIIIFLTKVL